MNTNKNKNASHLTHEMKKKQWKSCRSRYESSHNTKGS
ncbi:hypothetical protein HPCPY1313_1370 [Helicobacter pylori CPY1313]|nr:hypothetical protein HPCPY1313_1370 [Helicobacter pylori CPY1313]